jgi:hypothetical protein
MDDDKKETIGTGIGTEKFPGMGDGPCLSVETADKYRRYIDGMDVTNINDMIDTSKRPTLVLKYDGELSVNQLAAVKEKLEADAGTKVLILTGGFELVGVV